MSMASTHSTKRKQQYKLLADRTIQEVDKIPGPVICLEILALSLCIGIVLRKGHRKNIIANYSHLLM